MRAKGYSESHTKLWLDSCKVEDSYYTLLVPAGEYVANSLPSLLWELFKHRCWHLWIHRRWVD